MVVLGNEVMEELLENGLIADDYENIGVQLQPAGFDLRLDKIWRFRTRGTIDFTNDNRQLTDLVELTDDVDDGEYIILGAGAYIVRFKETVKIPSDCLAITRPRSSLVRCGASIQSGFGDPGYEGKYQVLLLVHNDRGIKLMRGARIAQVVFLATSGVDAEYDGIYQNEGVD